MPTRFQTSDFILDILYRKDETGVPVNYIAENQADSAFNRKILLRVLKMDNLDSRNEPNPDGRFDFIEGTTINARDGRVFFTQVEPFGSDLRQTITGGDTLQQKIRIADKYVFEELYDSTQTKATADLKKEQILYGRGISVLLQFRNPAECHEYPSGFGEGIFGRHCPCGRTGLYG